ncbi:FaeA-like protein [Enterobacter cancerogenus]|uniref:FaeA-like protein n=1 Tax=Enterobacter cancerogenus TaxID=69218 RepID=A0A484WUF3_9ENTR|nr:FaeA-like protein [Enterobacter cancerogenus]HDX4396351.1 hypothetical protein [Enterobacter bugandensis]
MMSNKAKELSSIEREIILAIEDIQRQRCGADNAPPYWIRTREIAEKCDVNIYKARYLLLKLERKGLVTQQANDKKSPLCWRSTNYDR